MDDEESFLEVATHFLKKVGGFEVNTALSVDEALEMERKNRYDVIISDYQMSGKDGIDFLKTLKGEGSETPFILFTGKGREDVAIEALNQGADYYLQKGGDLRTQFHELASIITRAVISRRAADELKESQERFKKLADGISDLFIGLDRDLRVTYWNRAATELLGLKSSDVLGNKIVDILPQFVNAEIVVRLERALTSSSKEIFDTEVMLDGTKSWFEASVYPSEEGLSVFAVDVTNRRTTEMKLSESEQRYRALVESSPDGIVVFSNGKILYANPAAARMYGCDDAREMVGRMIFDAMLPEDREKLDTLLKDTVERKKATPPRKASFRRLDGRIIEVESISSPVMYEGRIAVQTVLRDLSERRKVLDALSQSEEKFSKLFKASPVMLSVMDLDSRTFIDVNDTYLRTMEYERDEVVGRESEDFDVVSEADKAKLEALLTSTSSVRNLRLPVRTKSGKDLIVEFTAEIVEVGDRKLILFVSKDISEEVRIRTALDETEHRLRLMAESAKDCLFRLRLSPEFAVEYLSPAVKSLSGYGPDEFYSNPALLRSLVSPEGVTDLADHLRSSDRSTDSIMAKLTRKDGQIIWVDASLQPIYDDDGELKAVQGIARDVTEWRNYEQALDKTNRKLNLLGNVTSHDSLNQLTVLKGWLDTAMDAESDESVRHQLEMATNAAEKLRTHLEFAAEYRNLGVKQPGWINVPDVLSELVADLGLAGVDVNIDLDDLELYSDPMIENVFSNLITNSLTHGGDIGSISIVHRIESDELVIVYEDDGVGIPVDEKEKIFEPGYGAHTGYGLYLNREVLSITGMSISENGAPGDGARFEIRVPSTGFRMSE